MLAGALAIFLLVSPYTCLFPTNRSSTYNALLAIALLVYFCPQTRKCWRASFACFAAAVANWTLGLDLVAIPGDSSHNAAGITLNKLAQFLEVVPPILLLTLAVRAT
jgi:hypothetical protein